MYPCTTRCTSGLKRHTTQSCIGYRSTSFGYRSAGRESTNSCCQAEASHDDGGRENFFLGVSTVRTAAGVSAQNSPFREAPPSASELSNLGSTLTSRNGPATQPDRTVWGLGTPLFEVLWWWGHLVLPPLALPQHIAVETTGHDTRSIRLCQISVQWEGPVAKLAPRLVGTGFRPLCLFSISLWRMLPKIPCLANLKKR